MLDRRRQPDLHRRRRRLRSHRSIVDDHSIALSGNLLGLDANRGVDGRFYSQYGIGHSIYNVPFYLAGTAAQRLIGRRIGKPDTLPKAAVALGSAVAAADRRPARVAAVAASRRAAQRQRSWRPGARRIASPLWPYSKFGFSTRSPPWFCSAPPVSSSMRPTAKT